MRKLYYIGSFPMLFEYVLIIIGPFEEARQLTIVRGNLHGRQPGTRHMASVSAGS
jgi:hypothetical protein